MKHVCRPRYSLRLVALSIPVIAALSACNSGDNNKGASTPAAAQTAPAMSVTPQASYKDSAGNVDPNKVAAVQSTYSQEAAKQAK